MWSFLWEITSSVCFLSTNKTLFYLQFTTNKQLWKLRFPNAFTKPQRQWVFQVPQHSPTWASDPSQCLTCTLFVWWYPLRLLNCMTLLATADRKEELHEGEETNENLHWQFIFLSTDMPLTSTKPQLPMLIIRNSKLSKLKIISSSSTTYYTILQTQTHENNWAVENVQQLWCYRE